MSGFYTVFVDSKKFKIYILLVNQLQYLLLPSPKEGTMAAMKLEGNRFVIINIGVLELPECVSRLPKNDGWGVTPLNRDGKCIEFYDKHFKDGVLGALRKAVAFAIVFGDAEAHSIESRMLEMQKERLKETGVTGVYHRSGLQEYYLVKLGCLETIVAYDNGKGFTKACRERDKFIGKIQSLYKTLIIKLGLA